MEYAHKRFSAALILVISLLIYGNSAGQFDMDSVETWVKEINSECSRINNDTATFKVIQKDVFDQSSEGGFLRSYYDGKILRKAILTLFGENGQSTSEYYLLNGQIIFSLQTGLKYKTPSNVEKTEIESEEKDRLYLKGQKLIRWYRNDNIIVSPALYPEKEEKILEDLKIIL